MRRSILAAALGYLCMALVLGLGGMVQWQILGAARVFEPGSRVASTEWSLVSCLTGLIAAIVGGVVAAVIDRAGALRSVKILIGIVLALGVLTAIGTMMGEPKPMPDGKAMSDLDFGEAHDHGVQPTWFSWVIPIVGAVGTWIGAIFVKPMAAPAQADQ